MATARKKRSTSDKSEHREAQPAGGPAWDPAAVPAKGGGKDGPTLAEEQERAFHATHFSADPRGAAKEGTPPPGSASPKKRGGTPPGGPADV
jgi:hypothetical protein